VAVDRLENRGESVGNLTRTEQRTVPRRLTEFAALLAIIVVVGEIAYVRRRGDL
jgi:hypothetical protein